MKIEYLEYLVAVANAPSITAAAQRLYISQTALSAAIRSLEKELRTELFQRTSKGVNLTAEGERVMQVAEEILEKYRSLFPAEDPRKRSITIGAYAYDYNALSFGLIRRLEEESCPVQLNVYELEEDEVVPSVVRGDANMGVGLAFAGRHLAYALLAKANGLCCEELCQDRAYLYVSAASHLADRRSVRVEDLREERFVTSVNSIKPFKNAGLHRRIPRYCVLGNSGAVLRSILENHTVTLMPERAMRGNHYLISGAIRQVAVEDVSTTATYYLVRTAGKPSRAEEFLLDTIRAFYQDQSRDAQ